MQATEDQVVEEIVEADDDEVINHSYLIKFCAPFTVQMLLKIQITMYSHYPHCLCQFHLNLLTNTRLLHTILFV